MKLNKLVEGLEALGIPQQLEELEENSKKKVFYGGGGPPQVGGGGASSFLDLTDTPASYVGSAGMVAIVNPGETALVFDPNYLTLTDGSDASLLHIHDSLYYTKTQADDLFVDIAGDTMTGDLNFTGAGISETDYVDFNTAFAGLTPEGRNNWNTDEGVPEWGLGGGSVVWQGPLEDLVRVVNKTGLDLVNGRVGYITGAQGNRATADYSDNTDVDTIFIAGIFTETISDNRSGYIATSGRIRDLNTTGSLVGETWVDGQKLYLSTNGNLTNIHPTDPTHATIIVCRVERAHATEGVLLLTAPQSFTLGNNFDGTLRQSIINKSDGVGAGCGFTAVNDADHYMSIGITGSNNATLANAGIVYNLGYGDTHYIVDGAKDHIWYTDPTDSHNWSYLSYERMRLSVAGDLTNPGYASNKNFTDSDHYTGFPNRTDTSLSWDDGTYTLTLTASADDIWIDGVAYEIDTLTKQLSVAQEAATAKYWFWITAPGGVPELNCSDTFPGFDTCLTAEVYWNTTTSAGILVDERHSFGRDKSYHEYLHETFGARYASGLAGTFDNTTLTVEAGEFYDEDIEHLTVQETTAKVLYHNGDADWAWDVLSTPYKVVNPGVDNTLYYNNGNALAAVNNNRHTCSWVYISGDEDDSVHIYLDDDQYITLAAARASSPPARGALTSPEDKLIYKVIYKNVGGTPTYIEAEDFRASAESPSGVTTDHGSLSGLTDDDHGQYALLAGRVGGQTLIGSTLTAETLTLQDNSVDGTMLELSTVAGDGVAVFEGAGAMGVAAQSASSTDLADFALVRGEVGSGGVIGGFWASAGADLNFSAFSSAGDMILTSWSGNLIYYTKTAASGHIWTGNDPEEVLMVMDNSGNLDVKGILFFEGDADEYVHRTTTSAITSAVSDNIEVHGTNIDLYSANDINLRIGTDDNFRVYSGSNQYFDFDGNGYMAIGGPLAGTTARLQVHRGSNAMVAKFTGANPDGVRASIYTHDTNKIGSFYSYDENDGGTPAYVKTYLGHAVTAAQALVCDPVNSQWGFGIDPPLDTVHVEGAVLREGWFVGQPAAQVGFTGASTDIDIDTEIRKDTTYYTHSAGSDNITVLKTGWYRISYCFNFDSDLADRTTARVAVYDDGTAIANSWSYCYIRFNTYGKYNSCSTSFVCQITANSVIDFRTSGQAGTGAFGSGCDYDVLASSQITIERVDQ